MDKNPLKLYNTLTKKEEIFKPQKGKEVKMYSCGPTVYNYAHIGNLRTYIFNDILKRILLYNNFKVKHVMNLTDVDDKTIRASRNEGISLKQLTKKYENIFFSDLDELNILKPSNALRATENIKEMVSLIQTLLKKEYAYKTSDGIYFSINKSKNYGKLAGLDKIKKSKERIKSDEYNKENPQDFALWKFYTEEDGPVFWNTKIGKGRPGWHIECSAMSMKILGKTLDIHTGAQDLIFPHHTNEIAQSEGATGKQFVKYWLHAGFLNMKEGKMSKSLGNILTLKDIKSSNFEPIHYRYLCLQTHYKKPLDFSLENLDAAKNAYERIKRKIIELKKEEHKGIDKTEDYKRQFKEAINNDLNMPEALKVFHTALDDFGFTPKKKLKLLEDFDKVLGLNIKGMKLSIIHPQKEVEKLLQAREQLRKNKQWAEADILRERIREHGFEIEDTQEGAKLRKI